MHSEKKNRLFDIDWKGDVQMNLKPWTHHECFLWKEKEKSVKWAKFRDLTVFTLSRCQEWITSTIWICNFLPVVHWEGQTGSERGWIKGSVNGGTGGWTFVFVFFILWLSDLDSKLKLATWVARSRSATLSPLSVSLSLCLFCSAHCELSTVAVMVKKRHRLSAAAAAALPPALRLLFF